MRPSTPRCVKIEEEEWRAALLARMQQLSTDELARLPQARG
jgi:hypothetical protein